MFFLLTHIMIGKYYPNLFTQFIIGCICYIIAFLLLKDLYADDFIVTYKYQILSLLLLDIFFIIYEVKNDSQKSKTSTETNQTINSENNECTTTENKTGGIYSISLSSEINDFRITHDPSVSEISIEENSLFSTSDEKSPQTTSSNKNIE